MTSLIKCVPWSMTIVSEHPNQVNICLYNLFENNLIIKLSFEHLELLQNINFKSVNPTWEALDHILNFLTFSLHVGMCLHFLTLINLHNIRMKYIDHYLC